MKQSRRWGYVIALIVFGAVCGGIYGERVEATTEVEESDVQGNLQAFTRVYNAVEQNYADPVDADKAIYGPPNSNAGAIPGMLRTLDPHSNFFDPRAFSLMREQMQGHYFGVGMRIQSRPGKLGKLMTVVVSPIPGSPAFRAGLRPGDVITAVDAKPTDNMTSSQVADALKGPKDTVVHITVNREGSDKPLEFTVTRAEINTKSIDVAFMIRPNIAYIHIDGFNETTNEELTGSLKRLEEEPGGIRGMILDLRGNPGGLLKEAVEVSDHFLEKNQLIVYHSGRRSREQRYRAANGNKGNEYPMVVLIDRNSASASEIVTGALQDHDRALVMGEPSFGKGLVQSEFMLPEHTMLLLTTARYYTPSGRLIQRDYSNVSLYDYYNRSEEGSLPHDQVRMTDGGREVYGGGGIAPDINVPPAKLSPAEQKLLARASFFNFSKYYLGIHKTIPRNFEVSEAVMGEFEAFLQREKINVTDADIARSQDFVKTRIKRQLVESIFGEVEAGQFAAENDPLVLKALDKLGDARLLMANAKKYTARVTPQ